MLKKHKIQIHAKEIGTPTSTFYLRYSWMFFVMTESKKFSFFFFGGGRAGSKFIIRRKQQKWSRTSKMHLMAILLKSNKKKKKKLTSLKSHLYLYFFQMRVSLVQLREYFAAPNKPETTVLTSKGICSDSFTLLGMERGCSLFFDGCLEKQCRDQHILDLRQPLCAQGSCEISFAGGF